jgi:hypothetical protein
MAARMKLEQAYPKVAFRWRSRNWWARLTRTPPECIHLEREGAWMATFVPDTLYLRGKASHQRQPIRPEVSLCRECLAGELVRELSHHGGKVIAFEPDGENFTQYFYVGADEFDAAGLRPEVAQAIRRRLHQPMGECRSCDRTASWLWFPREEVPSLDEIAQIGSAPGKEYCAQHGAQKLCAAFEEVNDANLFYVNAPYGEAGAYVWI